MSDKPSNGSLEKQNARRRRAWDKQAPKYDKQIGWFERHLFGEVTGASDFGPARFFCIALPRMSAPARASATKRSRRRNSDCLVRYVSETAAPRVAGRRELQVQSPVST